MKVEVPGYIHLIGTTRKIILPLTYLQAVNGVTFKSAEINSKRW